MGCGGEKINSNNTNIKKSGKKYTTYGRNTITNYRGVPRTENSTFLQLASHCTSGTITFYHYLSFTSFSLIQIYTYVVSFSLKECSNLDM